VGGDKRRFTSQLTSVVDAGTALGNEGGDIVEGKSPIGWEKGTITVQEGERGPIRER